MLGNIQTLQTTLTEQYKVGILGGDLNKNAYQNLIPALQRIREAKAQSGGMIDVAMNTIPGIKDVATQDQVQTIWNMTPEEYKDRWGLGIDYPMVAPDYAKQRSELAKSIGLGKRSR